MLSQGTSSEAAGDRRPSHRRLQGRRKACTRLSRIALRRRPAPRHHSHLDQAPVITASTPAGNAAAARLRAQRAAAGKQRRVATQPSPSASQVAPADSDQSPAEAALFSPAASPAAPSPQTSCEPQLSPGPEDDSTAAAASDLLAAPGPCAALPAVAAQQAAAQHAITLSLQAQTVHFSTTAARRAAAARPLSPTGTKMVYSSLQHTITVSDCFVNMQSPHGTIRSGHAFSLPN